MTSIIRLCSKATDLLLSDPNLVWGLSFIDLLILTSRIMVFHTNYNVKPRITRCFDQEYKRIPRKGQNSLFLTFLDPSSPRLASGSPGPPNSFMVKKPTRLGELTASGLSFSLPGRALARLGELQLPQSDHLPINRRPRGVLRGSKDHLG